MKKFNYPKWLQAIYPGSVWGFSFKTDKTLYLTFDDGPNPDVTPWVLKQLDRYNAKATFFCVGKNAKQHSELIKIILDKGHQVGNHTMNHINGFKTNKTTYLDNVKLASKFIPSHLFRPPYGKLTPGQHKTLKQHGYKTIFWSFLSYDFDMEVQPEHILKKAKRFLRSGDIIVCHDSEKAAANLKVILPQILDHYSSLGFSFKPL